MMLPLQVFRQAYDNVKLEENYKIQLLQFIGKEMDVQEGEEGRKKISIY